MIYAAVLSYQKQPSIDDLSVFGAYLEPFAGKAISVTQVVIAEQNFEVTGLKVTVFRIETEDNLDSPNMHVVVLDKLPLVRVMLADITGYIEGLGQNLKAKPTALFTNEQDIAWCVLHDADFSEYERIFAEIPAVEAPTTLH